MAIPPFPRKATLLPPEITLRDEEVINLVLSRCKPSADCMIWQGCVQARGGTPVIRVGKKTYGVRRLMLLAMGIDVGKRVGSYTCESRLCVAPEHLRAMDHSEVRSRTNRNMLITSRLAKQAAQAMLARSRSKLTQEDVEAIRCDPRSYREIAKAYGVTKFSVYAIKNGVRWAQLHTDSPFVQLIKK